MGGITDPGVAGKENQDDFFVWQSPKEGNFVLGVLDGHGRELGRLASTVASAFFVEALNEHDQANGLAELRATPEKFISKLFVDAHEAVRQKFKEYYEKAGWEVKNENDILLKRRRKYAQWTCIHGGTTCTILFVLDGHKVYVANVGDSSAVVGGVTLRLLPSNHYTSGGSKGDRPNNNFDCPDKGLSAEVSGNHSPEEPKEFMRVRSFRPSPKDANQPQLRFVYDSIKYSKALCKPIFAVDPSNRDKCTVTNTGVYYKNVRSEWATLVCTPSTAKFQDALAFTRSIGDFHLQSFGVSHLPEIRCLDLLDATSCPYVISLASDGVWDNWTFEDSINDILRDKHMINSEDNGNSMDACKEFMQANIKRGHANFGNQADNMTIVLCYVYPE